MAKDVYHDVVKNAIIKDGWTITHDPMTLTDKALNIDYEIDLGAEKLIAAERGTEKIAIEVKSFLRASLVHEFHAAFGQYLIYAEGLKALEPDRKLYLALPEYTYLRLKEHPFLLGVITAYNLSIVVYDIDNQSVLSWIK
jgi:XisH protein